MKARILWFVTALTALIMSGCATPPHMTTLDNANPVSTPQTGKALVMFLRPAHSTSDFVVAHLFDDNRYVGSSKPETVIPYQVEPGKHLFMVMAHGIYLGDGVNFMSAELAAGKTYYVVVSFAGESFDAIHFALQPQNGDIDDRRIQTMLQTYKPMVPTLAGFEFGDSLQQTVAAKKAQYLPLFEQLGDKKPMLKKESGV